MSVKDSWIAGQEAVVAFHSFCLNQGWVFVEVPGQSDFGKDAYVDIVEAGGVVSGSCFAVQLKGGRSHRRTDGYAIEGSPANRRQWIASTMPVIGVAHDRDSGWLYWVDLTDTLNRGGVDVALLAPTSQHLNGEPEIRRFTKYVDSLAYRQAALLNMISDSSWVQRTGIQAAYRIGRSDGRALVLLRRLMFSFDDDGLREAVLALASAGPHPDIFQTWMGMVHPDAQALVAESFRWSPGEIVRMLALIGSEGGFERGSMGQHIHLLLVRDPSHAQTAFDSVALAAEQGTENTLSWAAILATGVAGADGPDVWRRLTAKSPEVLNCWAAPQIQGQLEQWGRVTLH